MNNIEKIRIIPKLEIKNDLFNEEILLTLCFLSFLKGPGEAIFEIIFKKFHNYHLF